MVLKELQHNGALYLRVSKEQAIDLDIPEQIFNEAFAQQQAQDFFESEKTKAILIMNDHMLGTGQEEITDLQFMDVKAYIQSIDPAKGFKVGISRAKVPRPSIFSRYD